MVISILMVQLQVEMDFEKLENAINYAFDSNLVKSVINEVVIPERAVVKFRAGKELKVAVEKLNPANFKN